MDKQTGYGKEERQDSEKVVYQVAITSYENGNVNVTGFPLNVSEAISLLMLAIKAVMDFFINAAIDGKLKRDQKFVAPNLSESNTLN